MKEVYFANAGLIDLNVIRLMGVSVKDSKSPIGYFGTGLKYAIATLLRHGQEIELIRGGERFVFSARETMVRGEAFRQCFMNDEPLPFTTELGKKWEVWQAYRELHSNMLDEGGLVIDEPIEDETVLVARGESIHMQYLGRDDIFLATKPIAANSMIEVHPGESSAVFYRGVRAGHLPNPGAFTYNFLCEMELTEDRTFRSQWDVEWKLATTIPRLHHKGVISKLLEGRDSFDQSLAFNHCGSPSEEFIEVASQRYNDTATPQAAKAVVERDRQERAVFKPATMLDHEKDKFLEAFPHLQKLGCSLSPEDVEIVESLGPETFAMFKRDSGQIYLAKMTFDWGLETLVAALYEEWLHKDYHYKDRTTALQNFLFQRLVALAMGTEPPEPEKQGEPF